MGNDSKFGWLRLPALISDDGSEVDDSPLRDAFAEQSEKRGFNPVSALGEIAESLNSESRLALAEKLLKSFAASGHKPALKWMFVPVGVFGGDEILATLEERFRDWLKQKKPKSSELAARAIAVVGTPAALQLLDRLKADCEGQSRMVAKVIETMIASATKAPKKEAPKRVAAAFEAIPDFGIPDRFESGYRVSIGVNRRFGFVDVAKDRVFKSCPKAIKEVMKPDIAELKAVVKKLDRRLEQALVRQDSYDAAAWSAFFQDHPLGRAYAMNLVWWDGSTFTMSAGGGLIDVDGKSHTLKDNSQIRLAHPTDLDGEGVVAWLRRQHEAQIDEPFPQMARRVLRLPKLASNVTSLGSVLGNKTYARTLMGRADRMDWRRAAKDANGFAPFIYKQLPDVGLIAVLVVNGLTARFSNQHTVNLGEACFARQLPKSAEQVAELAISLSEVPPVIRSEIVFEIRRLGKPSEIKESTDPTARGIRGSFYLYDDVEYSFWGATVKRVKNGLYFSKSGGSVEFTLHLEKVRSLDAFAAGEWTLNPNAFDLSFGDVESGYIEQYWLQSRQDADEQSIFIDVEATAGGHLALYGGIEIPLSKLKRVFS